MRTRTGTARLNAHKLKRYAKAGVTPEPTFDDDNKEVLRQTRHIHSLEAKRRELKRRVAEISRELKARRKGLRAFLVAVAWRTTRNAEAEFESGTRTVEIPSKTVQSE